MYACDIWITYSENAFYETIILKEYIHKIHTRQFPQNIEGTTQLSSLSFNLFFRKYVEHNNPRNPKERWKGNLI